MNTNPLEALQVSQDYLWQGRLTFLQPTKKHGYRFNLDPVLLSGFCQPEGHILDLGTGCGIIGILLLALKKAVHVTGVERQNQLAELAQKNAALNGFEQQLSMISGDLRSVEIPQVDAVVFNPPYYPADKYRKCGNIGRDAGRRECHGTLNDFLSIASEATSVSKGPIRVIIPAQRHGEILQYAKYLRLGLEEQCWVLPRQNLPAVHVMLTLRHMNSHGSLWESQAAKTTQIVLHPSVPSIGQAKYTTIVQSWVDGPNEMFLSSGP